ncbi:MAG: hypothetical protein KatS3mg124_1729 [Porticoccaceae bacterium]|nr:MAG: hypothetical protein KatS3mg124_1729 [Porticoccaceae bacterium]
MIRHVVMIKFKKDARQEDIDLFIEELKKLPHLNREVRDYSHGFCVKEPRFHSGDFDFANCCDLDSYEAMERYMSHWAHLRMTPYLPAVLDYMISFDWEIDYHGPPFDEAEARAEAEREKARVLREHPDPALAWVPEVRGTTLPRAREMLERVGLALGEVEEVEGSVWAPGRVMMADPAPESEVPRGTRVNLVVTGQWLSRPERVPEAPAW